MPDEGYGEYEISLRFPIGNDIYENIITNLPENGFHAEEIKKLYRPRWDIETSFCTLKHAIAVNFHS
ncbi:MAG: transposase [Lachnospiraceae bacterium]|nr:transposase [Lachnospiraceae bacterium]